MLRSTWPCLLAPWVGLMIGMGTAAANTAVVPIGGLSVRSSNPAPSLETRVHVAYVNMDVIYQKSAPALAARALLQKEFQPRELEITTLSKTLQDKVNNINANAINMSPDALARANQEVASLSNELQLKKRQLQEDFNRLYTQAFAAVVNKVQQVVRRIAQQNNYDLVIQQDVLYVSPRADITQQVLEALKAP